MHSRNDAGEMEKGSSQDIDNNNNNNTALFMRHISSHYGHSKAHYSLKHLHIISNIMIKMPNKTLDKGILARNISTE